ncbi:MAG: LysM peptidoglycan-binding domain-containing protein, partial [Bacillota bacterium]
SLIYPGEQLCVPVAVDPPAPPRCPGGILYAVRRGETLTSIARKFGVTVTALRRANPGIDPDRLAIGQVICIPGVADELCPDGQLYTVRPTDSMFSIARRFGITLSRMIAANPWIPDPSLIYPGEQLCVPVAVDPPAPPRCPGGILYAVRRGETLTSIARKFGVTVTALRRANPGIDPDRLAIGQVLCIPGVADELCPGRRLYTVRRSDSMFSIARAQGVSLNALIRANPQIPDPDLIYPGEQLCIPRR